MMHLWLGKTMVSHAGQFYYREPGQYPGLRLGEAVILSLGTL